MALVQWQPRYATCRQSPSISSVFDSFWGLGSGDALEKTWSPRVDVSETDGAIMIASELPGLKSEDIKITVADGVVTLEGEKKEEEETTDRTVHRVERTYGAFRRSFRLPSAVNADEITATFADGVLSVNLPKAEEAKARQIEVKTN